MSKYTISLSDNQQYVLIKVYGELDRELAKNYIKDSHELASKHGIEKFLIDATEAVNVESPVGNFDFAEHDIKEIPSMIRRAKVATVVAPDDHSHDFVETLVRNRGHNVQQFRNFRDALNFLEVTE